MKINIVIDGNFLLYKDVFVLKKLRSIKDLSILLVNDFNKLTKSFAFDNIYFVSDSVHGNWRKQIYQEYKGERVMDKALLIVLVMCVVCLIATFARALLR